ncbi:MAG TPA: hypothetical protein VG963_06380 [Polyangiaceae bacterium]|nr:hypothetical protein [Polyangiaceae bacterium]
MVEQNSLRFQELPQVVFTDNEGERHTYLLNKLPAPTKLPNGCLSNSAEVRGTGDVQQVTLALRDAGYRLLEHDPPAVNLRRGRQHIFTLWTFEDVDRRALLKIAFNYLTQVCSKDVALFDKSSMRPGGSYVTENPYPTAS